MKSFLFIVLTVVLKAEHTEHKISDKINLDKNQD
jgi:hypothetical protein